MKAQGTSASPFLKPPARVLQGLRTDAWQWLVAAAGSVLWVALCLLAFWIWPAQAWAQQAPQASVQASLQAPGQAQPASGGLQWEVEGLLKQSQAQLPQSEQGAGKQPRVEVVLGQLDPRLKLAPCDKVHAYLPEGMRLWGRARVGLRCEQGPVRWNVFWPVTVKVWGQGLVAAAPINPGAPIQASDLQIAEVDLAAAPSAVVTRAEDLIGRNVVRGIQPGQAVRQDDVKARRWFAAGDPVRLTVRGKGFQVAGEGTALTHGDEGHCARIRTENGRVICGNPIGDRQVELSL